MARVLEEGRREFKGVAAKVLTAVTALYGLYLLLYTAGILTYFNVYIYGQSNHSMILGIGMSLAFIYFPATKASPRDRVPWYDVIAVVLSLVVNFYLVFNIIAISRAEEPANAMQQALGLITVVLILECVRRSIGPVLSLLGLAFVAYPFICQYLPALFRGPTYSLQAVMGSIYLYPTGIYGSILHLWGTIIAAFLIFGAVLVASGAGDFLIRLALSVAGHTRGGPAKVAVLASAMFGSINGSTMANAAVTGVITIPLMKRIGYRPEFAGAVEAVASNGGSLMPPMLGVTAFIMMDILGVSYSTIMLAATLPAIVYFYSVLLMVDIEAVKVGLRGLPQHELPSFKQTIRGGWLYFVPVILLVWLILVARYSPQTAAIYSLGGLLLLGLFKKEMRLGPRKLIIALSEGTQSLIRLVGAVAVCGLLLGSISLTGIGFTLSGKLVVLAGENVTILLLLTAGACIILGTTVTTIAVYLLTAVLMAPALIWIGMPPLAAHFFVWYMGLAAMITPPVCLAAYLTATIAGSGFIRTGFESTRLGIVTYLVPFAIAFSPALILIGSPGDITLAFISALIAVTLMSYGLQGFLLRRTSWLSRIMLFAGGLVMFWPLWTIKIIGLSLGLLPVLWQVGATRLARIRAGRGPV